VIAHHDLEDLRTDQGALLLLAGQQGATKAALVSALHELSPHRVVDLAGATEPRAAVAELRRCAAPGEMPAVHVAAIIDAATLFHDLGCYDLLRDRGWAIHPGDARTVADVVCETLEYAHTCVLVVSAPENHTAEVETIIRTMNPTAELVRWTPGDRVPHALRSARVDLPPPDGGAAWELALAGPERANHASRTRFFYAARTPFHPARLSEWLIQRWPGLLRVKGRIFIANRLDHVLGLSQAGGVRRVFQLGRWWSAEPLDRWPTDPSVRAAIRARMVGPFGDREQRIALVGRNLDAEQLTLTLDKCLLHPDEIARGAEAWARFPDPLAALEASWPIGALTTVGRDASTTLH